jgi:glycerol-3-phosphate cytidylyltransferase
MIRIGYAPGAFDLFHIGHLNLLRRAKEQCDFLIAGVVADEVLVQHKKVTPVIPLSERIELVRTSGSSTWRMPP